MPTLTNAATFGTLAGGSGDRGLDTIDHDAAQLETLLGAVWTTLLPRNRSGSGSSGSGTSAAAAMAYRCLWESSALSAVAHAMARRNARISQASAELLMTRATVELTAALHVAGGGNSGGGGTDGGISKGQGGGVLPAFADMSTAVWAQPSGALTVMSAGECF